jgi:hypothetical protein
MSIKEDDEAGMLEEAACNALYEEVLWLRQSQRDLGTSTGLLASNPSFQTDLALESAKIVDELDAARYWPMVTLHGRYKF